MKKLLIICATTLILMGCCSWCPKQIVVQPPVQKACVKPVRPILNKPAKWDFKAMANANNIVIKYALDFEEAWKCWEEDTK